MSNFLSLAAKLHGRMTFERYCAIFRILLALFALIFSPLAMTRMTQPTHPAIEVDRDSYRLADRPWVDERGNRYEPGSAIHRSARLGHDNRILPYAIVGPDTVIGDENRFEPFAIVGASPQTRRGDGGLILANGNIVHSHATISRGAYGDTVIGSNSLFMAASHVGHDCVIGNGVTLGNSATLAGHVTVDDGAIVGAFATVIQHSYIGGLAHVLPQIACRKSLVPGETFDGSGTARVNTIGIRRAGGTIGDVRAVRAKLLNPGDPLEAGTRITDFLAVAMIRWDERAG